METQIKNSFDAITRKKVFRSFILTLAGAIGVVLIALSKEVELQKALLVALGTMGSWLSATALEYKKGE
jgi:uncharacterized membrane protein YdfJ with MMPL/SSD domain